ncbi:hypothetical protein IE53DRAFT_229257 [Violaceomyces palustris]|uniref:Uncharacterized protein n=1 Tax=Violaceomyces palustris TaxID=1673888 RepID=A0ACD0NPU4_9BASI|nr:hypothetical protein IE53DRAFT_229257 [Violaceomyces palustris]
MPCKGGILLVAEWWMNVERKVCRIQPFERAAESGREGLRMERRRKSSGIALDERIKPKSKPRVVQRNEIPRSRKHVWQVRRIESICSPWSDQIVRFSFYLLLLSVSVLAFMSLFVVGQFLRKGMILKDGRV